MKETYDEWHERMKKEVVTFPDSSKSIEENTAIHGEKIFQWLKTNPREEETILGVEKEYPNQCGTVFGGLNLMEVQKVIITSDSVDVRRKFGDLAQSMLGLGILKLSLVDGVKGK